MAKQQILLRQQEVGRILLVGRVGKPLVATGNRDRAWAVIAESAFAGHPKRRRRTPEQTCVRGHDAGGVHQGHPGSDQQLTQQRGRIEREREILGDPDQVQEPVVKRSARGRVRTSWPSFGLARTSEFPC